MFQSRKQFLSSTISNVDNKQKERHELLRLSIETKCARIKETGGNDLF